MFPINNIEGIEKQEAAFEGLHVVVLFLVKPSDTDAEKFYKKINYYHYSSKKYCSMYLLGCTENDSHVYPDSQEIKSIDNGVWFYSDICFLEAKESL